MRRIVDRKVSRRVFLKRSTLAAAACVGAAARGLAFAADRPFDVVIAGGTLIDSFNQMNAVTSVAIQAGKIVQVAETLAPNQAMRVIRADGLYVSPGWIDLHAHVFGSTTGVVNTDRDVGVHAGVTTMAEAGGVRASDFDEFRRRIVEQSRTRALAFLNVTARPGGPPVHGDAQLFDQKLTISTILANRDVIQGVKVLSSQRHSGNLGIVPTQLAVQAARESGTRVMAHIGVAPPLIQDVLNLLDRGDIVTHSFKGFPGVVRMATLGPAELVDQGRELGSASVGTVADLTVFRVVETPTTLTDSEGNSETGRWDVEPVYCIRGGEVIDRMKTPPRT